MSEALGRVCSLFLRYGDHGDKVQLLVKHLKGIGGSGAIGFGANRVESIADAVAKALEMHVGEDAADPYVTATQEVTATVEAPKHHHHSGSTDLCPSCGTASLINVEGCKTCTNCGYSKCS
jgi:ribonucleoside-diphosphate reductase alpha chain